MNHSPQGTKAKIAKASTSDSNLHQLHLEKNEAKQELSELDHSPISASQKAALHQALTEIIAKHRQIQVADYGSITKAKEQVRADRDKFDQPIDEDYLAQTLGPDYLKLRATLTQQAKLTAEVFARQLALAKAPKSRVKKLILEQYHQQLDQLQAQLTTAQIEHPILTRAAELASYKADLYASGHIAMMPTTQRNLTEIGQRLISGLPMFLHGATGTGKTSLAKFAAKHFTGQEAEVIYCNPQTRESNIWGAMGIEPVYEERSFTDTDLTGQTKTVTKRVISAQQTIFKNGPLATAMKEGRVVVFDEFTALPKEQMVMIKGLLNAKPGDEVNIVGDGKTPIAPGFQFIFTANLKSAKNTERQDLPPEMANEFDQNNLEINYSPQDETYDTALIRLMDEQGNLEFSRYDLAVTLPQLCKAFADVQEFYQGTISPDKAKDYQAQEVNGKIDTLQKLVWNQRTLANIITLWRHRTHTDQSSFVEFLDKQLVTSLTFKEYTKADRALAAKVLVKRGLIQAVSESSLGLDPHTISGFQTPQLQAENIKKSQALEHFNLQDLANLDPFQLRQQAVSAEAAGELGDLNTPDTAETNPPNPELFAIISTPDQFQSLINAVNPQDYLDEDIMNNIAQILPQSIEKDFSKYNFDKFGTDQYDTRDQAEAAMKYQGYRPANLAELLSFIQDQETAQNLSHRDYSYTDKDGNSITKNKWFWPCADPASVLSVGSSRWVGYWNWGGDGRKLGLDYGADGWSGGGFWLAVRN